ncbi:response regulator [Flavobacterium sp. 7A]|uniref:response regulator n=1 Tax=Flavobacterium sp. 7A TaxID=2940571 RepID=UPI002226CB71|nr:response regulator [Flavobacterium sp. 7A]MCW2118888.1 CheY-like chemotaxis protein [Flavobacterium sp. 7A]
MKKKSIWVVDDDPIYQIIMKKIIDKSDLFSTIVPFTNGKQAIDALKKALKLNNNIPEIILLDIEMPVMDGWSFMEELKQINNSQKNAILIYISSSSIAVEDKEKAKDNKSILGYMSKPIKMKDLIFIANS